MLGWSVNIGDREKGEIEYVFTYPRPTLLRATLWFRDDEWVLGVAWVEGGAERGFEEKTNRNMNHVAAKKWAEPFVKEVLAS